MENFDLFSPILENATKLGKGYYLLGLRGNTNAWEFNSARVNWTTEVMFESYKMRRLESYRHTKAMALVYMEGSNDIFWKTIYRNKKGIYVKLNKVVYLEEAPLPENMK